MFMLNSFIKKVDGDNGCTLTNLENSDVIDLGNREALLLTSLLNNSYDGLDNELKKFLIENNWIVEVNNMSKSENLNYLKMELQGMTDFTLKKVLLELSTKCLLNCVYCDENSDNAFASCTCKRWNYNKVQTDYHELAEQIVSFDVEKIIIIGGDPFFDSFENLKELLFCLKEEGYKNEIVIYTNGSCLDKEKILFIKEFQNIRINIMFLGCNEEDYKYITNTSGILKKVIKNIKLLLSNNISVCGTLLLNNFNINNLNNSILQTLNIYIGIKYIFDESYTIKEILFNPEDRMIKNDYFSYQVLENTNCCLFSQIFISSDLKIYPCPYLRNFVLGDIKNSSKDLYKVFREDKYRKFWFLCKSKISGCELCKYRLQCLDCRAVEFAVTKDLYKEYYCKIASQLKVKEEI